MPSHPSLPPGGTVAHYELVRLIARGSMGAVWEAVDTRTPAAPAVAVKVMHPRLATDGAMVARFVREAEAAARVAHPNVVRFLEAGQSGGRPYLAMERLVGEDLARCLRREGALGVERTTELIAPVVSAIANAHLAGVVHRDLKPENIFLQRTNAAGAVPRILDFGISKLMDASLGSALTRTSEMLGTPYYMSPEQIAGGKRVDARTDQYALGVVLYECLSGARPFDGDSIFELLANIARATPVPLRSLRAEVPEALERAVLRALARTPEARFGSVYAIGRELLPFAPAPTRARFEREFSEG